MSTHLNLDDPQTVDPWEICFRHVKVSGTSFASNSVTKITHFTSLVQASKKTFQTKIEKARRGEGSNECWFNWNYHSWSTLSIVWHESQLCFYFLDQAIKSADDKVAESKNMDLTKFPPLSMKWSISIWWGESLKPQSIFICKISLFPAMCFWGPFWLGVFESK